MATIKLETFNGVKIFHNVTHFWNSSCPPGKMNGDDLITQGFLEIIYDDGEKATIDHNIIKSFSFSIP